MTVPPPAPPPSPGPPVPGADPGGEAEGPAGSAPHMGGLAPSPYAPPGPPASSRPVGPVPLPGARGWLAPATPSPGTSTSPPGTYLQPGYPPPAQVPVPAPGRAAASGTNPGQRGPHNPAQRARAWALNAVIVAWTIVAGLAYASFGSTDTRNPPPPGAASTAGQQRTDTEVLLFGLALAAVVALGVLLIWRRRWALWLALAGAGAAIVLPIDSTAALFAAAAAVHYLDRRRATIAASAAALATAWACARDAVRPWFASVSTNFASSLSGEHLDRLGGPIAVWTLLFTLLAVGVAVGVGFAWRQHEQLGQVEEGLVEQQAVAQQQTAIATQLGDEVARSAEREAIAREVHDTIGHDLSVLSLQAAALEAAAGPDAHLAQEAAAIRGKAVSAHGALRSLVDALYNPRARAAADAAAQPSLDTLGDLLDESRAAGMDLGAMVLVGADQLAPTVSAAVFRIIQESLTNARRHAPGMPVHLDVRGSRGGGIDVEVRNELASLPVSASSVSAGGHGLTGMRERVTLLGGTFEAGAQPGPPPAFVVHAHLPWQDGEAAL